MKGKVAVVVLSLMFLAGCGKELKEFSPSGGKFSIKMPGFPVGKMEYMETDHGSIEVHSYTLTDDDIVYGISYAELPPEVDAQLKRSFDAAMNRGRDGMVARFKGRLVKERGVSGKVVKDGKDEIDHYGKEVVVDLQDSKHSAVGRMYWNKNVMYQVTAIAERPIAFSDQVAIDKYFESLVMRPE